MESSIVLLNGASSSGKTSVARSFQEAESKLWLLFSLDSFLEMFPSRMNENWPPFSQLTRAYYETAKLWAESGYNLIVDTVIDEQESCLICVQALSKFRVYSVGLTCALEELSRREMTRVNRERGLARRQFDRVHKFVAYDLEIDTTDLSIEACASKISKLLGDLPNPAAFKRYT